jgi:hypothetical protein
MTLRALLASLVLMLSLGLAACDDDSGALIDIDASANGADAAATADAGAQAADATPPDGAPSEGPGNGFGCEPTCGSGDECCANFDAQMGALAMTCVDVGSCDGFVVPDVEIPTGFSCSPACGSGDECCASSVGGLSMSCVDEGSCDGFVVPDFGDGGLPDFTCDPACLPIIQTCCLNLGGDAGFGAECTWVGQCEGIPLDGLGGLGGLP